VPEARTQLAHGAMLMNAALPMHATADAVSGADGVMFKRRSRYLGERPLARPST
jgi:hypothetical protein